MKTFTIILVVVIFVAAVCYMGYKCVAKSFGEIDFNLDSDETLWIS